MPTLNHLKSLLKRVDEQVRTIEGGLRHIDSEQKKLDKKRLQFQGLLKIRKEESEKLTREIDKMNKEKSA